MSDMGDMYREMREEKQRRREENRRRAAEDMDMDRDVWTCHNTHHYSRDLQGTRLQYWPSANRWHWNGRSHTGKYPDLKAFIRNRQS